MFFPPPTPPLTARLCRLHPCDYSSAADFKSLFFFFLSPRDKTRKSVHYLLNKKTKQRPTYVSSSSILTDPQRPSPVFVLFFFKFPWAHQEAEKGQRIELFPCLVVNTHTHIGCGFVSTCTTSSTQNSVCECFFPYFFKIRKNSKY